MLNFTYNLTSDYYPLKGLDAQLKAEIGDDIDSTGYWYTVLVIYALIFLGMLIAMFTVCCKDFDPLSEFERRRKKQTKDQKEAVRKAKKEAEKAAKKGGKKPGKLNSDAGSDIEKLGAKKGKKGSKQAKESLEIEEKPRKPPKGLKGDGNKYKNEFKAPLLDEDED